MMSERQSSPMPHWHPHRGASRWRRALRYGSSPSSRPKTDRGTIILHWLLVGSLLGAVVTGLSMPGATPSHGGTAAMDYALAPSWISVGHVASAIMVILVSVIYPIYMWRAALIPRIRLDRVRLHGLAHPRYRWATVNVMHNWVCYIAVLTQILTGGLSYVALGGSFVIEIHRLMTWLIIALVPVHVLAHFAFGGFPQLLRLLRQPAPLAPRPLPFDLSKFDF